ncbi:putative chaperone protein DNAj [Trypanosoma conorhini]|uniref:Putative chaperone protein DNAj n=1 Tax=Trypanosoma conorhini TaxID=83891 RepID=A0A3R7PM09_9TRYP|nr:putative chaperone protein DNAj [Trypanosoma conorhini]RNF27372.1 putative chaperone protein DNAj [Trypanosoma conorhini]
MFLCRPGRCWDEFACRYAYPSGAVGDVHPLLATCAAEERLREQALKRESRRRRSAKRDVTYEPTKSSRGGGSDGDYYAVLGVERDATARQIKEAYNRLVLEIHPDKNPSKSAASQFDAVTKAYRVLGNAEKRRKYDIGGTSVVEDIGEKKRDAVRALFGGDALYNIVGDVKTGSFSQRVVDGLDWTQDELAACRQRMLQRCRDELLTAYLQPLQHGNTKTGGHHDGVGLTDVKRRLQGLLNTGLAKEVLCAVGQEYMRVVRYSEARSALQRLQFFLHVIAPHRVQRRVDKWRALGRIRQHTFKDSAAMVDLAWYTSVEELESTARWVATAVILDPRLPLEERQRRREALRVIAETFVVYGQVYKGANRQTMDTLMNSLREYKQQQQQQRRDSQ